MDGKMKAARRWRGWIVAAVLAAALVGAWVYVQTSPSMLFPRMMIDRFSPLSQTRTVWAAAPDPDGFASSYEDATGAYDNYLYLMEAVDERGEPCEVGLISFNGKLEEGGYLVIDARGFYAERYARVELDELPDAVAAALGEWGGGGPARMQTEPGRRAQPERKPSLAGALENGPVAALGLSAPAKLGLPIRWQARSAGRSGLVRYPRPTRLASRVSTGQQARLGWRARERARCCPWAERARRA